MCSGEGGVKVSEDSLREINFQIRLYFRIVLLIIVLGTRAAIIDKRVYSDKFAFVGGTQCAFYSFFSALFFFLRIHVDLNQVSYILDKVFRRLFKIIQHIVRWIH